MTPLREYTVTICRGAHVRWWWTVAAPGWRDCGGALTRRRAKRRARRAIERRECQAKAQAARDASLTTLRGDEL